VEITVETNIMAPIEEIWRAYMTPEDIRQWNAASDHWHTTAASVDLREGGEFSSRMEAKDGSMGFDFAGTYTKIIEARLIEYSFGDRKAQVEFTPGRTGVKVRVTSIVNRPIRSSNNAKPGRLFSITSLAMSRRTETADGHLTRLAKSDRPLPPPQRDCPRHSSARHLQKCGSQ
jgi:uncharacterized protein YndB with AHSA1/START domain